MDTDSSSTHPSHHKKTLHSKRSFGVAKHALPLDSSSPAYDASEEDNDPLTDDGASMMSVPVTRNQHIPSSPLSRNINKSSRAKHQLASGVSTDDGVDSPTYDGDIESSTTAGPDSHRISSSQRTNMLSSIAVTLQPPQSDTSDPGPPSQPVNAAAVPLKMLPEPSPVAAADVAFQPASLTPEDIQKFVRDAIDAKPLPGGKTRKYKINKPPVGRPVRIYADGVYDLFHFGHALQLRQGKLSFPSVYLLVGVCSDELVRAHKSRSVMTHAERCEAVRHCRWVDEVVQEAPWVIDSDFLDKWEIDYVAHDEDPYAAVGHDDVYAFVKEQGKFLPTRRTPGVSTSELLERIVAGYRKREFDTKLEKMGHSELKAEGSDYDDSPSSSRAVSVSRMQARGRKVPPGSLAP